MNDEPHIPVMLNEVLECLVNPISDEAPGVFIDGTFGNGGYSRAILERGHRVIAIDRDPNAIRDGQALVEQSNGRLRLIEGRFGKLDEHIVALGEESVDGVVLDIGVSSMQLDQAERGFSFRADGPLDMRMEQVGPTAADVVNRFPKSDLKRIISVLGEEKKAGFVAHAIVEARAEKPILTTSDLAAIAEHAVGKRQGDKIHPATRTFQALRIFVNRELEELASALFAAERILKVGGRLVVVAFHSLEDRIVKRFLKERSKTHAGASRHMPQQEIVAPTFKELTRRALSAGDEETRTNPRARSAKLRAAIRLDAPAGAVDMRLVGVPNLPINLKGGGFLPGSV